MNSYAYVRERFTIHILELEVMLAMRSEFCTGKHQGPLFLLGFGYNFQTAQSVDFTALWEIPLEVSGVNLYA